VTSEQLEDLAPGMGVDLVGMAPIERFALFAFEPPPTREDGAGIEG
jgi:hypothetical protein